MKNAKFSPFHFRIMQACCDVAFQYVHERKQFNQRIGEFQLMQVGAVSSPIVEPYQLMLCVTNQITHLIKNKLAK